MRAGTGTPNQARLLQQLIEERDTFVKGSSRERLEAYLAVFTSAAGKIVLKDLKSSYGGISLTPGYPDVTAFREGRRSVADDIEAVVALAEAAQTQGREKA